MSTYTHDSPSGVTFQATLNPDGTLVVTLDAGGNQQMTVYDIDAGGFAGWINTADRPSVWGTACTTCGALYGEMDHAPEPCKETR